MGEERKGLVALDPEDVFLSFVSNEKDCDRGNNLNLVTYSFPKLQLVQEFKIRFKERLAEMQQSGELNKDSYEEAFNENKKEFGLDPDDVLKAGNIVIGNYRLVRESSSSEWTFTEMGQASVADSMSSFFAWKWKARLTIHAKTGIPFITVLRADLVTDFLVINLILFLSTFPPLLGGLK